MADQSKNPKESPKTKDLPLKNVSKKDEEKVKGGISPIDPKKAPSSSVGEMPA
jgi:hypothetical protein